jgi:hypothetical protein
MSQYIAERNAERAKTAYADFGPAGQPTRNERAGQPWRLARLPVPTRAAVYELLTYKILVCTNCFIPRFDLGLLVQNHVQQGTMDLQSSIVFDKTQLAELVHEKAYARSGRADHLRQHFLTELSHDRLRPAFLAEICKEKEKSGEALFARIEQLID